MKGFDPAYKDIVAFIKGITHRIWEEGDMGYIYDTYTPNCTVHTGYGLSYGVEQVLSGSLAFLAALPDRRMFAEDVIWTGDDEVGFHTSHLIVNTATNTGFSPWGPPTGKRVNFLAIANCFCHANRISEEWLVRDTAALIRQLGFNLGEVAAKLAAPRPEIVGETDRLRGQRPPEPYLPQDNTPYPDALARRLFHDVLNLRHFNKIAEFYAPDAVLYVPNHQQVRGLGNIRSYFLGLVAMFPDAFFSVEQVFGLEQDGLTRIAIRWRFSGTHLHYGWYGVPTAHQVQVLGISHVHLKDKQIIKHYLVFDELALLAQLYAIGGADGN